MSSWHETRVLRSNGFYTNLAQALAQAVDLTFNLPIAEVRSQPRPIQVSSQYRSGVRAYLHFQCTLCPTSMRCAETHDTCHPACSTAAEHWTRSELESPLLVVVRVPLLVREERLGLDLS